MAAEEATIDPMHQFQIDSLAGDLAGNPFAFTNSALWMLIVLACIWLFMLGGMKRQLVPTRWQAAVEGVTGFITSMIDTSIGPEGRKYVPWVFTVFIFILFANFMGMMPFGIIPGVHPFTVTSQFTDRVRGVAPGGWDSPSPCEGWTARDVVGHLTVHRTERTLGCHRSDHEHHDQRNDQYGLDEIIERAPRHLGQGVDHRPVRGGRWVRDVRRIPASPRRHRAG